MSTIFPSCKQPNPANPEHPLNSDPTNNILWPTCDPFRGTIDASGYNNYLLGIISNGRGEFPIRAIIELLLLHLQHCTVVAARGKSQAM